MSSSMRNQVSLTLYGSAGQAVECTGELGGGSSICLALSVSLRVSRKNLNRSGCNSCCLAD